MNIDDLIKVNSLWWKMNPYLVAQVMEGYQRDSGLVLELGPFSGGISMELARQYPGLNITIADESPQVVDYLEKKIAASGLAQGIAMKRTDLNQLTFNDCQFDLVIFRGALFFLDEKENLLREAFRVLREGGMAFVGGGHGKGVPQKLIDEVADELRQLNKRLGGRWVRVEELEELVKKSGLSGNCRIEEEGGVWLIIRK